jgi:branched-chain amino acid transport system ATP-binding protein
LNSPLLEVTGLDAGYGDSQVLFDVSFAVARGEVVSLLGRNGMGKTTTILALMGLLRPGAGTIRFDGASVAGRPPFRIAQAGVGYVPEGRQVFPTLTVEENLLATAIDRAGNGTAWTTERIYALFPKLRERRKSLGRQLSGGEQQMLAIGRALMTNPRLLILDEATEGLAPLVRQEIWACLAGLKAEGQSILVVDKNVGRLIRLADRHVILEKGRIAWTGDSAALAAQPELRDRFLHV